MRPVPTGIELVIIGGGNMGAALLGGLLAGGRAAEPIAVDRGGPGAPRAAGRDAARACTSPTTCRRAPQRCSRSSRPTSPTAARAAVAAGARRLLSIAAGVTIAAHREAAARRRASPWCGRCRTRRRSSAEGASAIAAGAAAGDDDLAWAEAILGAVGLVVRVDESQLDAVTGLTGSGPAYVFLVAEALIEAGVGGRPAARDWPSR